jgi:predicted AAA+ superfamily ATPase
MIKIICTGSSAFYIDEKFKDSLVGRKKIFELQVLDFDEFLLMKGQGSLIVEKNKISTEENYISLYRNELNVLLDEYMTFGAYPAVVKANETEVKMDILKDLFQSYVKKDIFEAGVKQQEKFYQLMKILAHQSGSLLNINELSNTLGISTSAVSNYINVLQKTFHISLLRPFCGNIRKELTKMPKLYFSDLGLRNLIVNMFQSVSGRIDKGGLFENLIYGTLVQKYQRDSLKFWRTAEGNEVDFVVDDASGRFALEVKFSQNEFKPSKYSKFCHAYPDIPLQCVSYHSDNNITSVWRWL